jgi:D-alanyl-D-alanine dipeptidase
VASIEALAAHERAQKQIPALSIALVQRGRVVWARGFGWADSAGGSAATAATRYLAGGAARLLPALPRAREPAAATAFRARGTIRTIAGRRFDAPLPAPAAQPVYASVVELARAAAMRPAAGAIEAEAPGYALTVLTAPHDSVAAVVAASLDGSGAVTRHIAGAAVRALRALRAGRAPPPPDTTRALAPGEALRLAGRYGRGRRALRLVEYEGGLFLEPWGGIRAEVRRGADGGYVTDDAGARGTRLLPLADGRLVVTPPPPPEGAGGRADTLERVPDARPAQAPPALARLLGEYGPADGTVYVLERDGALAILLHGFDEYPLTRTAEGAYRLPPAAGGGLLRFVPGAGGRPVALDAGGARLLRRPLPGDSDAVSFRIVPVRPVEELRREALAASPPQESGAFRPPDLVELRTLDPTIHYDIRYATANNFLGTPMYSSAHAFLQRPAAEAVARASARLRPLGYGLLVHDAYRPWYVTRMFWDATPADKHVFVADPARGSRHNRGAAVDLTLYQLGTGLPVRMTGGYDEMSDRSYPLYPGGSSSQRWHRDLLRHVMEAEGFTVYDAEWWHFDYLDWRGYPILNRTFEELAGPAAK